MSSPTPKWFVFRFHDYLEEITKVTEKIAHTKKKWWFPRIIQEENWIVWMPVSSSEGEDFVYSFLSLCKGEQGAVNNSIFPKSNCRETRKNKKGGKNKQQKNMGEWNKCLWGFFPWMSVHYQTNIITSRVISLQSLKYQNKGKVACE